MKKDKPTDEGEKRDPMAAQGPDGASPEGAGPPASPGEPGPEASTAPDIEPVPRPRYEELVKKADERDLYRTELLRERADFTNYQKRVQRDRQQHSEQSVRRFVVDLLPVLDNFDRALSHEESGEGLRKGIEIVRSMLVEVLKKHGIEEIEASGKPFDPNLHEAVVHEESKTVPPDTVSEVVQKGYIQSGVVVRAAKVKVARAPLDTAARPGGGA